MAHQELYPHHGLNITEVQKAQKRVLSAGLRFLLKASTKAAMPLSSRQHARKALVQQDVVSFLRTIREYAIEVCKAVGSSKNYWLLVDACGLFEDAVGTQWKYITTERRQQNLIWAFDMASEYRLNMAKNIG